MKFLKRSLLFGTMMLLAALCKVNAARRILTGDVALSSSSSGDGSTWSSSSSDEVQTQVPPVSRQETEVTVLVEVVGQPGDITEFQYNVLEQMFVDSYNYLAKSECDNPPTAVTATIERYDESSSTTQVFALKYLVTVKGDSLFYPQGDGYTCPGVTEEAFALAYSQAVEDSGSNVEGVGNVIEMEPFSCNDSTNEFQSDAIVSFIGNPALSTQSQLDALAKSFRQTYNVINIINPDTCDTFFRRITDVTLVTEDGFNRRLEETIVNPNDAQRFLQSGTRFSYLYRTRGRCRGCPSNSRLFAQGSSGRMLAPAPFYDVHRELPDADVDCMCPVGATEQSPPTEGEFQDAYETSITLLQKDGVIDDAFIESVINVREVNQVDCGPTNTFETQVYVELFGTPESVTEGEVDALDLSFSNTYKQVADGFCDPFFRTPVDITIDTTRSTSRHLQEEQNSSTFTYVYDVTASCRGCPNNSRLFGEAVARMLSRGIHGRRFQQDNFCFCSSDVIDDRAPSTGEFAVAYNDTVKDLDLPHIEYVVGVFEPDGDEGGRGNGDEQGGASSKSKSTKVGEDSASKSKSTKASKSKSTTVGEQSYDTKSSKSGSQSKASGQRSSSKGSKSSY